MKKLVVILTGAILQAWWALAVCGAGLTWPAYQFLPTFSTPATIDCISMDSIPNDQQILFCSLEGIVNRTQPRVGCVSAVSEGAYTWLALHRVPSNTVIGFREIQKYQTNVTGLMVYLQRSGIRTIPVWDAVSGSTADAYATNCPTLVGINDQSDGYYTADNRNLPVSGLPSGGNYASSVSSLVDVITSTAASWNESYPITAGQICSKNGALHVERKPGPGLF